MKEIITRRFLEATSGFTLPPSALAQTVGWSSERERPISLREFVAARAPQSAREALRVSPEEATEPVKRVTDLNEEELRETTCAVLREAPADETVVIVGTGELSTGELIRQVRAGTELGQELISATRSHIDLLEQLVETGKLSGLEPDGEDFSIKVLEFPF